MDTTATFPSLRPNTSISRVLYSTTDDLKCIYTRQMKHAFALQKVCASFLLIRKTLPSYKEQITFSVLDIKIKKLPKIKVTCKKIFKTLRAHEKRLESLMKQNPLNYMEVHALFAIRIAYIKALQIRIEELKECVTTLKGIVNSTIRCIKGTSEESDQVFDRSVLDVMLKAYRVKEKFSPKVPRKINLAPRALPLEDRIAILTEVEEKLFKVVDRQAFTFSLIRC